MDHTPSTSQNVATTMEDNSTQQGVCTCPQVHLQGNDYVPPIDPLVNYSSNECKEAFLGYHHHALLHILLVVLYL